ncbi:MAG TPA: CRISPR-associated protein Csx15 [Bacillota bacterium]
MYIINMAHPLTEDHIRKIQEITGETITGVKEISSQIDHNLPLEPQIETLLDQTGFSPQQWQTESFIVNLPALNYSAAIVLAQIHGRAGYFPPVIRLRPVPGQIPRRYEIAEILNLQDIRDRAREKR